MDPSITLALLAAATPLAPVANGPATASELTQIRLNGDCIYRPATGTSGAAKVDDVVTRFNAALICRDLTTAQLFVADGGTVSEVEEFVSDDGKVHRWIDTGLLANQLFLFTRPSSEGSDQPKEKMHQGRPTVLVDGASAIVRVPFVSETGQDPVETTCLVQHLLLADDGDGWKILHMMLIKMRTGCAESDLRP